VGGEADAVAPFEAHLHVAHVRPRLAQRGHQPTSAEHFVGARGHLVDEHDDARCARRAAWLRSCAICPTSWRGLAYVSSEFARTWNAIESTTTRRTLRPGRPGALFACLCVPATRRKCDVLASPPIAHGEGQPVTDRMTNSINAGVCSPSPDLCSPSFYARRRFEWYHRGPLTPRGSQITPSPLVAGGP
jgi:hypothetical protein